MQGANRGRIALMDLASDPTSAAFGLALLVVLALACFVLPGAPDDDQADGADRRQGGD
jgi:hypothetical protein